MTVSAAAMPAPGLPVLRLRRGEERRLGGGHLWVFSNEIDTERTPLSAFTPGALAQLRTFKDAFAGFVCVNPHALICARILSRDAAQPVTEALLEQRLRAALALRTRHCPGDYYRWVFGEADLLPGLVLDRYGEFIVGQIATAGMEALRAPLAAAVRSVLDPAGLLWKNDSAARELEQLPRTLEMAFGDMPAELTVEELGLSYRVPLAAAQKSGWFFDQTGNRARLPRYVAGGARVLDVCCYAGAWSLAALRCGAGSALAVDSSAAALAAALANAQRNALTLATLRADAFEALRQLAGQGARFDLVILDPPAFIKRKKDIAQGQAAYRKLNQLALALLADEGVLVSCSCSYHLAPEALLSAIQGAARHSGRLVQVLESGGQSPDHPLHPAIPETRYLKAFFCRVTRAVG
ncbi:MAG TPA: class I SAM-dependent rRNA methyltransferase [Steroidobacteraceae bacterium]|nr:class I SAM-dependent rRNA methyltransferase [Steroidobacteraceae bacterium]